jgi:hypothetical protein
VMRLIATKRDFIVWLLLLSLWQSASSYGAHKDKDDVLSVSYCDLIKDPEKYDGREVSVHATYMYGFEWQEMLCLDCHYLGKTWLEFDDEFTSTLNAALRKAPKDTGTVNAVFSGVFRSSGGPYGDGRYRFQFNVKSISDVKVVSKNGLSPDALPENARRKVCGSVK